MADILLQKPAAGQTLTLTPQIEDRLFFEFCSVGGNLTRDGDNLAISFDDGSAIILTNFYVTYISKNMPSFLIEGVEINSESFFAALGEELMPSANLATDSPQNNSNMDTLTDNISGGIDNLSNLNQSPPDNLGGRVNPMLKRFFTPLILWPEILNKSERKTTPSPRKPKRGDVIGVSRKQKVDLDCAYLSFKIYDHYGIYVDENTVIHFTSTESDISCNNKIQETSFATFLKGEREFFILNFPSSYGEPQKSPGVLNITQNVATLPGHIINMFKYKLYSPEDTIRRAKSKLDEKNYSLIFNNCEHFVIWCKTGISESHQVNNILKRGIKITSK